MALVKENIEAKKRRRVKLKVGDEVIVIAGKEKGKRGEIRFIDKRNDRVVVQGVKKIKRFQRPTQENPKGGVLEIEAGIHISNVMYYDSKTKQGKRIGYAGVGAEKKRVVRAGKGETREIKDKSDK